MIRPTLPAYDYSLVIRTDFSNDAAWEKICNAIQEPQTGAGFRACVECISDESCLEATAADIVTYLPADPGRTFVFLVDAETLTHPDHPVLVVDLLEAPGRSFRVIPSEAWGIENNLRLANVSFDEFSEVVGADGVFRGFPRP
jgi:hypothetical protein